MVITLYAMLTVNDSVIFCQDVTMPLWVVFLVESGTCDGKNRMKNIQKFGGFNQMHYFCRGFTDKH